jgi:hypothetical protein
MRALLAAILLALVATSTFVPSASAEEPVIVDMKVNLPDRITVGDRITYVVTLDADAGTRLGLVQSSLPPIVEVVDSPVTTVRGTGARVRVTLTFVIAAFAPGEIEIPPITLRYFNQDGTEGLLQTAPSSFTVTSVLPPEPDIPQPRDLKPQAILSKAAEPGWIIPALGGTVATLVLVLVLIFVRMRAIKHQPVRVAAPVASTEEVPEDRARGVLDTAGAGFSLDGDYIEYYSSIGVTVRSYLTERYGFPAFALTTRELEAEMLKRGVDRWQVRVASGLLEQCDSVVYAHYRPAAERADADLTAAYEIVEMSRPETEPEEAPVR